MRVIEDNYQVMERETKLSGLKERYERGVDQVDSLDCGRNRQFYRRFTCRYMLPGLPN